MVSSSLIRPEFTPERSDMLYAMNIEQRWPGQKPRCVLPKRGCLNYRKKEQWRTVQSYSAHSIIATSVPSDHFDDGMNNHHKSFGVKFEITIKIALYKHYNKPLIFFNIHCLKKNNLYKPC